MGPVLGQRGRWGHVNSEGLRGTWARPLTRGASGGTTPLSSVALLRVSGVCGGGGRSEIERRVDEGRLSFLWKAANSI